MSGRSLASIARASRINDALLTAVLVSGRSPGRDQDALGARWFVAWRLEPPLSISVPIFPTPSFLVQTELLPRVRRPFRLGRPAALTLVENEVERRINEPRRDCFANLIPYGETPGHGQANAGRSQGAFHRGCDACGGLRERHGFDRELPFGINPADRIIPHIHVEIPLPSAEQSGVLRRPPPN